MERRSQNPPDDDVEVRLRQVEAEIRALTAQKTLSRRSMMKGAAVAAAGLGLSTVSAGSASANAGDPLILGNFAVAENDAGDQSTTMVGGGVIALRVRNDYGGIGVLGVSSTDTAIYGSSRQAPGIYGYSLTGEGAVVGDIVDESSHSVGTMGRTTGLGAGVSGQSLKGRGGVFSGPKAQVRLVPSSSSSHPTSGNPGDLFVDASSRLWFCKGSKSWNRLA